jgi:hypothetical protein
MKNIGYIILLLGVMTGLGDCSSNTDKKADNLAPNAHQVIAEEVIQTGKYTYIRVSEDEAEYWIAVEKTEAEKGKTYYWSIGSEMKDFSGSELNRTFESIYFVQDFTGEPITESVQKPLQSSGSRLDIPEKKGIDIPRTEGCITIAELYARKHDYSGLTVRIKGEVVKFSPEIMDRNWVHIQDGTKDPEGNYDLTVTTNAFLNVGDIAVFEGTIALDKDFGYGYFYPVLLENAIVK